MVRAFFETQYRFYHAYHSERRNQLVHVVTVPIILWSVIMLLLYVPKVFGISAPWVVVGVYATYYLALDFQFGMASVPYLVGLALFAEKSFAVLGPVSSWKVAAVANVLSWAAQIGSHIVFEGKRPALFDSLWQAFSMAPLFVYLEALGILGIYRDKMESLQAPKKAED